MIIVFSDIPMKKKLYAFRYRSSGNAEIDYDKEVVFPVNCVLAKTMKKGERVKVVLLAKEDVEGNTPVNVNEFVKELDAINADIGAEIEYVPLVTPFKETGDVHENLFREIVGQLENGAQIVADVTYGPKPLPIILFAALNFAEKFFNAEIKNIVYGKVNFVDDGQGEGNTVPVNPELFDLTHLYYLNGVTNAMEYGSSEEALEALDRLLKF